MLKQNPNLINSIFGLVSKAVFTKAVLSPLHPVFNLPEPGNVFCLFPWHMYFPDSHFILMPLKNRKAAANSPSLKFGS